MTTIQRVPTKLELAEKRFNDAHDLAYSKPSSENDEWLFWSKVNYEQELHKAAKREAEILKDLNSADQNQGRMPKQSRFSEFWATVAMCVISGGFLFLVIKWLVTHLVVAR